MTSSNEKAIIGEISKREPSRYLDLPEYFKRFNYPVSLELSEHIGIIVYHKGFADALEFLCLMANKFYTWIMNSENPQPILESFIIKEGEDIKEKTRALINALKSWETGTASETDLAEAITKFCQNTYGVRFPMASFFIRMLLPEKFGTIDVHCVKALQSFGFSIKDVPTDESDKNAYFKQYSGFDYLEYNKLITEIGKRYTVPSRFGGQRCMLPSEVDMALYEFDKSGGIPKQILSIENKVQKIMEIVEKIGEGTKTGPDWVKRAGNNFLKKMSYHARKEDLKSMVEYCSRLADGRAGKDVGEWLRNSGLPSVESEIDKIKRIYED